MLQLSWVQPWGDYHWTLNWLVVDLPLWKTWKSDWIIIPAIGENKKCSKPPTSIIIYTNIFLRDSPFLVDGPEHHQLQESSTAPGVVWMPPAQHCAIRAQGRESHLRRGQENHLTGPAVVMATGWRLSHARWCPRWIAKLVNITPITMGFCRWYIYS